MFYAPNVLSLDVPLISNFFDLALRTETEGMERVNGTFLCVLSDILCALLICNRFYDSCIYLEIQRCLRHDCSHQKDCIHWKSAAHNICAASASVIKTEATRKKRNLLNIKS